MDLLNKPAILKESTFNSQFRTTVENPAYTAQLNVSDDEFDESIPETINVVVDFTYEIEQLSDYVDNVDYNVLSVQVHTDDESMTDITGVMEPSTIEALKSKATNIARRIEPEYDGPEPDDSGYQGGRYTQGMYDRFESASQEATPLEEATGEPDYDFTVEIENPVPPTPEQDAMEERGEDSGYDAYPNVLVKYSIDGSYTPAHITADPQYSTPAEDDTELNIWVYDPASFQEITKLLDDKTLRWIGEKCWEHYDKNGGYDRDDY